jgi:hypothetical protein
MTKKLISETGGMKTYVEIRNISMPVGTKYLRISTFYDGAKDPNSERTRFDMCMDEETFNALKDMINEV